jgi:hypothetical protein
MNILRKNTFISRYVGLAQAFDKLQNLLMSNVYETYTYGIHNDQNYMT